MGWGCVGPPEELPEGEGSVSLRLETLERVELADDLADWLALTVSQLAAGPVARLDLRPLGGRPSLSLDNLGRWWSLDWLPGFGLLVRTSHSTRGLRFD